MHNRKTDIFRTILGDRKLPFSERNICNMTIKERQLLQQKAAQIRKLAIEGIIEAGCGHPGGSLSIAEILSVLYFHQMKIDPQNPAKEDRDRFVLSKGHAAPAYYAALALRGYFDRKEMMKLRQIDSFLQGHPDMRKVPGVDMSTGSLGQGLSAANGMAMSAKAKGMDYHVYCIMGDGETQEGQIWEAAMTAAHYKLNNLTAFLDWNGLQIDGPVEKVMGNAPYDQKFKSFGWNVISIDGHDIDQIIEALNQKSDAPTIIICRTTKGKGVSFMENQCGWHGAAPTGQLAEQAMDELDKTIRKSEADC